MPRWGWYRRRMVVPFAERVAVEKEKQRRSWLRMKAASDRRVGR